MKRFKDWTMKPITWGGYLKLCAICSVIMLAEVTYIFGIYNRIIEKFRESLLSEKNESTKTEI